jgi:CRISPR-associated exonuclease Cas4
MEQESELVEDGRFIHETSYKDRAKRYKEVAIKGIKIDYYDPKHKVIHEVKRSDKLEIAHVWQLKYYIWVFKQEGIDEVTGVLEYPKLRLRRKVRLEPQDEEKIQKLIRAIHTIVNKPVPPKIKRKTYCRSCSYYDFCFVKEPGQ